MTVLGDTQKQWTADTVEALAIPAFIECRDGYQAVADAHNAALAAERERLKNAVINANKTLDREVRLQQQLDAEREKLKDTEAHFLRACKELDAERVWEPRYHEAMAQLAAEREEVQYLTDALTNVRVEATHALAKVKE